MWSVALFFSHSLLAFLSSFLHSPAQLGALLDRMVAEEKVAVEGGVFKRKRG